MSTSTAVGFSSILTSNQQRMGEIDAFRKAKVTGLPRNLMFSGMFILGFLLLGAFALQIISGIFAAVLSLGAGVGIYYGLKALKTFDPLIRQKMKNKKIELMVKEARENAVHQLDNQVLANHDRLLKARQARDQVGAQIQHLEGQINPENKGKPNYEKKMAILARLNNAYEQVIKNVDAAAKANKAFEEKVQAYNEMKQFANAAADAMSLLSTAGDDKLNEILSLEAFGQIETDFNQALIEIENSARDAAIDMGDE